MKKITSIIAIVLVICMLAACNNPVKPNEETTAGNTTEATTVAPTVTTEEPTTEVTEAPATETTEAPATETTEAPATETTEAPATETTEAPATETTEAPATETTEAPATETTEAPATETTEAPATETTEAPATETTEEVTEETEERPNVEDCTHEYEQVNNSLVVEGGSCVDGVNVTYECVICGHSWAYTYYNMHITGTQEVVDLGNNKICDEHTVVINECVCGIQRTFEMKDFSYSVEHQPEDVECDELVVYDSCDECGISATVKKDLVDVENCVAVYNAVIAISYYGEHATEFEAVLRELIHNVEVVSINLYEGASSCEDGVNIVCRCVNCGETWQETRYSHTTASKTNELLSSEGICKSHFARAGECVCGEVICLESDVMQWSYVGVEEEGQIVCHEATCPYCSLTVKRYDLETEGASRYEFFYGEEKIGEYSNNVSAQ